MNYLLDTNAVIAVIANNHKVVSRMSQYSPAEFGVPSIVMHDLYFGAWKCACKEANLARIDALRFEVLEFSARDAMAAAKIRATLSSKGPSIGPFYVLIAGQAVARSLVLITGNVRKFSRVGGLKFENWQECKMISRPADAELLSRRS